MHSRYFHWGSETLSRSFKILLHTGILGICKDSCLSIFSPSVNNTKELSVQPSWGSARDNRDYYHLLWFPENIVWEVILVHRKEIILLLDAPSLFHCFQECPLHCRWSKKLSACSSLALLTGDGITCLGSFFCPQSHQHLRYCFSDKLCELGCF